jgi:hypothetical protein
MKSQYLNFLMVTICLVITPETVHAEDLLVFMYGSGSVERYDADGKHLGTFISGLLHGWEGQRMDRRRIVYKCVDGSRGIVYNCGMTITQSNKRQTELASTHSRPPRMRVLATVTSPIANLSYLTMKNSACAERIASTGTLQTTDTSI